MEQMTVTAVYAVEAACWEHVYRFARVRGMVVNRGRARFALLDGTRRVGRGTVAPLSGHGYRVSFTAALGGAL